MADVTLSVADTTNTSRCLPTDDTPTTPAQPSTAQESLNDLESLPLKELRSLATRKGVNLTGCIEKAEVIQRIRAAPAVPPCMVPNPTVETTQGPCEDDESTESDEGEAPEPLAYGITDESTAMAVVEEARKLAREQAFDEAIERYSAALAFLASVHGDSAPHLAPVYLSYGMALLREYQATATVLNMEGAKRLMEEKGGKMEDTDSPSKKLMGVELAYAVVEEARKGLTAKLEKTNLKDEERKEARGKLGDAYFIQGEILHELSNHLLAVPFYKEAVAHWSEVLPTFDAKIGLAYAHMALDLKYAEHIPEAKEACMKALAVYEHEKHKGDDAIAERAALVKVLLEDLDCNVKEVLEEVRGAVTGTHTVSANNPKKDPNQPVNIVQIKKKPRLETPAPAPTPQETISPIAPRKLDF